jgi:rhodanese-related sulfurtransferase
MGELMVAFPSARRALFKGYHIGGCASCGFKNEETLAEVCARNENLPVADVVETILKGEEADRPYVVSPTEADEMVRAGKARLVDLRTREEWDAVHIEGSTFFTQELMRELPSWDRDVLVVFLDHKGARSLDAVTYFVGHGVENVRAMRGGIDGWSSEIDPALPRYDLE